MNKTFKNFFFGSFLGSQRRFQKISILFILLAVALLGVLNINGFFYFGGDNAHQIILAKSLVTGKGYRDLHSAHEPIHNKYPPITPLLFSGVIFLFGTNLFALKIVCLICALISLVVLYFLVCKLTNFEIALLTILFTGFSSIFINFATITLSEMPYLLFSLLALFYLVKYSETGDVFNGNGYLSLLFIVVAFLTRSVGIALLGGLILFFWLERNRIERFSSKLLFLVLPSLAAVFLWLGRSYILGDGQGGDYLSELVLKDPLQPNLGYVNLWDGISRVFSNSWSHFLNAIDWLVVYESNLLVFLSGFLIVLALFGFYTTLRRKRTPLHYYTIVYLLILLVWPHTGRNLLFPLFPFIFFYFIIGGRKVFHFFLGSRFQMIALYLLVIPLFFSNLISVCLPPYGVIYNKNSRAYYQAAKYINKITPANSLIMAGKRRLMYVWTNRKIAQHYPLTKNREEVISFIKKENPDYIVAGKGVTGTDERYLFPVIHKYSDLFIEVANFQNKTKIFQFKDTSAK